MIYAQPFCHIEALSVVKQKKTQKFYSAKLNTVGMNMNIDFGGKGFFYQKIN